MKKKQFYSSSAWKHFSRFILTKHAFKTSDGLKAKCATSGRLYSLNDRNLHCGHYIKVFDGNSSNFNTAFDERNCLPQSYAENHYMGGNPVEMAKAIDHIHGKGTAEELYIKSKHPYRLDKVEMKEISDKYRLLFKQITQDKGNAWD